jgi:poly(A) polymerase
MPIITPNYPSMCATHNVSASTLAIMTEQIQNGDNLRRCPSSRANPYLGADTVEKVLGGTTPWSELFSKHEFFHKYRNYIQVVALSRDKQAQIKW